MRLLPLLLVLLLTFNARATPSDPADEINQLLSNKGLFNRIEHAGQTVGLKASELVLNAMSFLGVPYLAGGSSGDTGFDCSGFVRAMFSQSVGLLLPRKAEQQAAVTQKIERTELRPGDLVFYNTLRRTFSHVGIYIGEGKFIHSPKPGGEVRVEDMAMSYWKQRFNGARRVHDPQSGNSTTQRSSLDLTPLP